MCIRSSVQAVVILSDLPYPSGRPRSLPLTYDKTGDAIVVWTKAAGTTRRARLIAAAATVAIAISVIATWSALAPRGGASPTLKDSGLRIGSGSNCVNSFDPACGPLSWQPTPGTNAPTRTSLSPSALTAVTGRGIAFAVHATDPDAKIACHWILFGDETAALIPAITMRHQYGRWVTPPKRAGSFTTTDTHAYKKPGTYHVEFGARSGSDCSNDYNPYGGESVATATVTISAS